jgi:Galactose oxidase, central domain
MKNLRKSSLVCLGALVLLGFACTDDRDLNDDHSSGAESSAPGAPSEGENPDPGESPDDDPPEPDEPPPSEDVEWTDVTPADGSPHLRKGHAMAFDPGPGGGVLLFGGHYVRVLPDRNEMVALNDLWTWDGAAWTELTPTSGSPPPRTGHAMAYDAARDRLVLFGGRDPDGGVDRYGDTWEWDGAEWVDVTPADSPPARGAHAMAYDAERGRVLLFGGYGGFDADGAIYLSDTWEWDGVAWTEVTPSLSPHERANHAMAYDAVRGRTVLFGGTKHIGNEILDNDLWEWDGVAWIEATLPPGSPSARNYLAMAYDAARTRTVMFGGADSDGSNQPRDDTWAWDGAEWTDLTPPSGSPDPLSLHAMVYDAAHDQVVLFGGEFSGFVFDDTWVLAPAGSP